MSKGFSMIEVICSLAILSLMLISVFSINSLIVKNHEYNRRTYNYINLVNNIKIHIESDIAYEDIEYIYENNLNYIKCNDVDIWNLNNKDINEVFSEGIPNTYPYIICFVTKDEIYKIELILLDEMYNTVKDSVIRCSFYKGEY